MGNSEIKENILFQLEMCWQLYLYHTESLQDEEALWSFSPTGLKVTKKDDEWCADWPDSESYDIGQPGIAWLMWHIIYWWSTALDYNFGDGSLKKEDILWPGSIEKAKIQINQLHDKWVSKINELSEADFKSKQYSHWPFDDRSFADIALWLNRELMKNAAKIGYGRFLNAKCSKTQ